MKRQIDGRKNEKRKEKNPARNEFTQIWRETKQQQPNREMNEWISFAVYLRHAFVFAIKKYKSSIAVTQMKRKR